MMITSSPEGFTLWLEAVALLLRLGMESQINDCFSEYNDYYFHDVPYACTKSEPDGLRSTFNYLSVVEAP